jgi:hypothetical protein
MYRRSHQLPRLDFVDSRSRSGRAKTLEHRVRVLTLEMFTKVIRCGPDPAGRSTDHHGRVPHEIDLTRGVAHGCVE